MIKKQQGSLCCFCYGDIMFKRFFSAAAAAALACACVPCVSAYDGLFSVSSGSVKAGDEVTIDVSVSDSTKLTAARLFVKYDASVFTLTDAQEVDFSGVVMGNKDYEPFTFLWIDPSGMGVADEGTFARLTFSCDRDAVSGDYDFSLFYEEEDCIDAYGYPLDFDVSEGKVTVTGGKSAETTKPVTTTTSADTTTAKEKKTTTKAVTTKGKDTDTTTTKPSETQSQTSSTSSETKKSESTTKDKDDSSEPDKTSKTTRTSDSQTETVSTDVTVTEPGDISDTTTTTVSAAASSDSSSSPDDKDTGSKKGIIAVLAFVGLCGIVLAVWLVFRIKKEK